MKHAYLRTAACLLMLILWGLTGTVGGETKRGSSGHQNAEEVHLGVLPFFLGRPEGSVDEAVNKTLSCSVAQLCYEAENIKTGAADVLTRLVNAELQVSLGAKLLPFNTVSASFDNIMQHQDTDTLRSLAKKVGADLTAQKMVVGIVWRYRDKGELAEYSGSTAASVAFAVYLIDVATGKREWRGLFNKTQSALTEDIGELKNFLKMGGKWLTAEELAHFGVQETFKTFPYTE